MKYKIISYDTTWQTVTVKATGDDDDLEMGILLTVSIKDVTSVLALETRIQTAFSYQRPPSLTDINAEILNHINDNLETSSIQSKTQILITESTVEKTVKTGTFFEKIKSNFTISSSTTPFEVI